MSEQTQSRKTHNLLKYGFLLLAALVLLLQMFNFKSSMLKSSITYLRHLPLIVESATYWFIPMVFGAVYSKRKLRFNEGLGHHGSNPPGLLPCLLYLQAMALECLALLGYPLPDSDLDFRFNDGLGLRHAGAAGHL